MIISRQAVRHLEHAFYKFHAGKFTVNTYKMALR